MEIKTSFNGENMKKAMILGTVLLSMNVYASQLSQETKELMNISEQADKIAERIDYGNAGPRGNQRLINNLNLLIDKARQIQQIAGGRVGPNPRPNPRPNPYPNPRPIGSMYTAKCHIDDDRDFTYDQNVVDVRGETIALLVEDCNMMADAMYPRENSSGVKDIKIQGQVPYGMQTAVCHLDDDPDMTYDQVVAGKIYGHSISDMIADCKLMARATFGAQGSSGLKDVNSGNNVPVGSVSGICHIDDDPDMTFDQFVPGIVFGSSIAQISKDCRDLAYDSFGSQGSSGLKEIKR